MAASQDSFEVNLGYSGISMKAQGKVTALISAVLSIGTLAVSAYFAQEAFLPLLKKKVPELSENEDQARVLRRFKRSAPMKEEEAKVNVTQRKRPLCIAAGISVVAATASMYFGHRAYSHFVSGVQS